MAGQDFDINVNIDDGSDAGAAKVEKAIDAIGAKSTDAAAHATKLLKVIAELMAQLDGMEGDAAKALRDDLQGLAEVINSLDIEKLQHLDGILEKINLSAANLSVDQLKPLVSNIKAATQEAKAFKDEFTNSAGVKLDVTFNADDALDDFRQRLDVTQETNDIIDKLKRVKDAAANIAEGSEWAVLDDGIQGIVDSLVNLSPDNVEKSADQFARIERIISSLPEGKRKFFKDMDVANIAGDVQKLRDRLQETRKAAQGDGTGISAVGSLLQGDIEGAASQMLKLVERTKAWGRAVSTVGIGKAAAAIGIVGTGISTAIQLAKRLVAEFAKIRSEHYSSQIQANKDAAQTVVDRLAYADEVARRAQELRDVRLGVDRAKTAGMGDVRVAMANMERSRLLATEENPEARDRINREADRRAEDVKYELDQKQIEYAKEDRQNRLGDNSARLNRIMEAEADIARIAAEAAKRTGEAGSGNEYLTQLAEELGFGGVSRIREAADTEQAIREFEQRLKSSRQEVENEIAKLEAQAGELAARSETLSYQRGETLARREQEDAERGRGYRLENARRGRELSERARTNREGDEDVNREYENSMRTYAEREQALQELLKRRISERTAKQKELDDLLLANADKEEQAWSEWDKQRRDWLEGDVQRLTDVTRSLSAQVANMAREGDTEGVSFARTRYKERYDRAEADRSALNAYKSRIGGELGAESIAQDELDLRKSQFEASRKAMQNMANDVQKRLRSSGLIGPNEKVNLRDERIQRMMTGEERARFENLNADYLRDYGLKRDAEYALKGAQFDRANREAEMGLGAMGQSNRLTAMGLGGGDVASGFGRDTAKNTGELVVLTREMLKHFSTASHLQPQKRVGEVHWGLE